MARRGDGIYLCGKTWWLDFLHDGKRHVVRIGKGINRTAAGEIARVQRAAILKGEVGIGGPKRVDLTIEKAVELFLAWANANKRPRTARFYRQCAERIKRPFAGRRLGEISTFDLERYKRDRIEAGAPVLVNRELACLGTLYSRCREWGKYTGENPVARVKPVRESRGRLRFLEPTEEAQLLHAAPEPLRTLILVGTNTGLRLTSEALELRWADVDLARGFLTVQAAYAKSGKTRSVPLNRSAREALATLRRSTGDGVEHVFTKPDGTPLRFIRDGFQGACRRAGLKGVSPHVLRHTFASRLAMAGVDSRTIQELGGWASLGMVQRYTHLSPTHKAEAVERIASNFPTEFTTPAGTRRAVKRNTATAQAISVG